MKCQFCGRHIQFFRFQSYFSEYQEKVSIRIEVKCPECHMVYETTIPLDDKLKPLKYHVDMVRKEVNP